MVVPFVVDVDERLGEVLGTTGGGGGGTSDEESAVLLEVGTILEGSSLGSRTVLDGSGGGLLDTSGGGGTLLELGGGGGGGGGGELGRGGGDGEELGCAGVVVGKLSEIAVGSFGWVTACAMRLVTVPGAERDTR